MRNPLMDMPTGGLMAMQTLDTISKAAKAPDYSYRHAWAG